MPATSIPLPSLGWFALAAVLEIAGCSAFWGWLREGRSSWWIVPGLLSLAAFASALARVDASHAGRAFAAYGGIYIVSSVLWLWRIEGAMPSRWDILGTLLCLGGTAVILIGPRLK